MSWQVWHDVCIGCWKNADVAVPSAAAMITQMLLQPDAIGNANVVKPVSPFMDDAF